MFFYTVEQETFSYTMCTKTPSSEEPGVVNLILDDFIIVIKDLVARQHYVGKGYHLGIAHHYSNVMMYKSRFFKSSAVGSV